MKFLALGTWAENHAGSLEKPFGNQIPGVGCAAPRTGGDGACVPRRPAAPDAGSGRLSLVRSHLGEVQERAVEP